MAVKSRAELKAEAEAYLLRPNGVPAKRNSTLDNEHQQNLLDSMGHKDEVVALTEKGAANGVATLDAGAKVPASQLPSYVDDVLEDANMAAFPAVGEAGKIYIAQDTNKVYRWSGSAYFEIAEGNYVRFDTAAQGLTDTQKGNARDNIRVPAIENGVFAVTGAFQTVYTVPENCSVLLFMQVPTTGTYGAALGFNTDSGGVVSLGGNNLVFQSAGAAIQVRSGNGSTYNDCQFCVCIFKHT